MNTTHNTKDNNIQKLETHSIILVSLFDSQTKQMAYLLGREGLYLSERIEILQYEIHELLLIYHKKYNLQISPFVFQYEYDPSDSFKEKLSELCSSLEHTLRTDTNYYNALKLSLTNQTIPSQQDIRIRFRKATYTEYNRNIKNPSFLGEKWEISINLGKTGFPKGRTELLDNNNNSVYDLTQETMDIVAKRELFEETGIDVLNLNPNTFSFLGRKHFVHLSSHIYKKYFIFELRLKTSCIEEVLNCIKNKNENPQNELTDLQFINSDNILNLNLNVTSRKAYCKLYKQ
jgi:8-oxo-dGTP pyrophosphatase MutT (NUDIX family)